MPWASREGRKERISTEIAFVRRLSRRRRDFPFLLSLSFPLLVFYE